MLLRLNSSESFRSSKAVKFFAAIAFAAAITKLVLNFCFSTFLSTSSDARFHRCAIRVPLACDQ